MNKIESTIVQNKNAGQSKGYLNTGHLICSKTLQSMMEGVAYHSEKKKLENEREKRTKEQTIQYFEKISQNIMRVDGLQPEKKRKKKRMNDDKKNKKRRKNYNNHIVIKDMQSKGYDDITKLQQQRTANHQYFHPHTILTPVLSKQSSIQGANTSYIEWDSLQSHTNTHPSHSTISLQSLSSRQTEGNVLNLQKRLSHKCSILKVALQKQDHQQQLNQQPTKCPKRNLKLFNQRKSMSFFKNKKDYRLAEENKNKNLIKLRTCEDDQSGLLHDQIQRLRFRKNKIANVMEQFVKSEQIKAHNQEAKSNDKARTSRLQKQLQKPLITNLCGEIIKLGLKETLPKKNINFMEKIKVKPLFRLKANDTSLKSTKNCTDLKQNKMNKNSCKMTVLPTQSQVMTEKKKKLQDDKRESICKKLTGSNLKLMSNVRFQTETNQPGEQKNKDQGIRSIIDIITSKKNMCSSRRRKNLR